MSVAEAQAAGNPGMVIIVAHGNPVSVEESSTYEATGYNIASTIEQLPIWQTGQVSKVVFDSCYTGATPSSSTPFNISQAWLNTVNNMSIANQTQRFLSSAAAVAAVDNSSFDTNISVKAPDNFLWPSSSPSGTGSTPQDFINIANSSASYYIGPAANGVNPLNVPNGVQLLPDPDAAHAGNWSYFGPGNGW